MQLIEEKFKASMDQAIECVREVIDHDLDMCGALRCKAVEDLAFNMSGADFAKAVVRVCRMSPEHHRMLCHLLERHNRILVLFRYTVPIRFHETPIIGEIVPQNG